MAEPCLLAQVDPKAFEKKMTRERRAMFWEEAKKMGANAGVDHATIIEQMSAKFNIPARLMAQALDGPKAIRAASEEVKFKQKQAQRFLADNARYLENMDRTGVQKLLSVFNRGTYKGLLAAHGPVIAAIHPLDMLATDPVAWIQQYGRGWQAITNAGRDRIMTDMKDPLLHPDYKTALDAGLPIGDDVAEGFNHTSWASRGMDASLKPLRLQKWEQYWYKAPPEARTPEFARKLAADFAHATGSLVKGERMEVLTRGVRKYLLAPQYTPSKIAKTIFDPLETARTYERMLESKIPSNKFTRKIGLADVRPPTDAEKRIANIRTVRAARFFGGTLGALALNEAILRATGSNQYVNYDHPSRSDFLAFKFAGHTWRMRGTLEIVALVAKLAALSQGKAKFGQQTPEEAAAKYSEYKLAPGIGLGKELVTGRDMFGRPSPWNVDPGNRIFPRKNVMEFVSEHSPIFLGHGVYAFHEALRDHGVDTRQSRNVMRAITSNPKATLKALEEGLMATGLEFLGVNVQPDRYIGRDTGRKL